MSKLESRIALTNRRVEGAANYRRVPLVTGEQDDEHSVYGTGMPSAPGYVPVTIL